MTGELASLGQPVTLGDGESLFVEGDTARVPGVGLLDFEQVRSGAAVGYRDAIERATEWAADRPWIGRRP